MKLDIKNLELLSILRMDSTLTFYSTGRPSHALVFRHNGAVDYDFGTWQTRQKPGEVMVLPKGCFFTATPVGSEESIYTVINFLGDFSVTEPAKLPEGPEIPSINILLDRCVSINPEREPYWLLSYFYRIFALLIQQEESGYANQNTLALLEPALEILRKNMFSPNLKIVQLHSVCGISNTHFRSLFVSQFGVSPKKYITDQRLLHAKQILDGNECRSIKDVARLSGFEDPLYFSRVFKARYGYSPSKGMVK